MDEKNSNSLAKMTETGKQPLRDIIRPGLKVLFVGYNPGLRSAEKGHHYAGASNRFWDILYKSGLTSEKLSYLRDMELMDYEYGSTNIIDRPSKSAAELTIEEYRQGRIQLLKKLEKFRPVVACYVGMGVFKALTGKRKVYWGLQTEQVVKGITDFVAPSTSGLNRMPISQQIEIYAQLKTWLDETK